MLQRVQVSTRQLLLEVPLKSRYHPDQWSRLAEKLNVENREDEILSSLHHHPWKITDTVCKLFFLVKQSNSKFNPKRRIWYDTLISWFLRRLSKWRSKGVKVSDQEARNRGICVFHPTTAIQICIKIHEIEWPMYMPLPLFAMYFLKYL